MYLSNFQSSGGKVTAGAIVVDESYSGDILQFNEGDGSWHDFGRILDNGMVALRPGMPTGKSYEIRVFNGPNLGSIDIGSTNSSSGSSNSSYDSGSYSSYSESSWWEYDDDENFFKTILLFPFRLPVWIVIWIYQIVAVIVSFVFQLGWAIVATVIGVPFAAVALALTLLVGLPLRVIVFILTFGNRVLWEDELFDWFESILGWIVDAWDFD
uniref:Uncharacterized protein n=1 Tax=Candidatus Kentrum sp. LFY TaxID=2126342 RepID=A0A450X5D1_9GAMM|nr:MAG: hypothetical protein BECKLFY1418C_GA0070996_11806 [Candidatus Kentron sp. LFY]